MINSVENPPFGEPTRMAVKPSRAATVLQTWLIRLLEAHILFPAVTILVLGLIWSATLNLIKVERTNAETAATAAALELVNTYHAQVVRALREIDQTLKLVKYVSESKGAVAALSELNAKTLLPPDLLFVVRIVNSDGTVLASTLSSEVGTSSALGILSGPRGDDSIWVDKPRRKFGSERWTLQFGRRVNTPDGSLAGAALLEVDASYFVSDYEAAQLGQQGTLGLLGTDGVVRAMRSGDRFSAGNAVDYGPTSSLSDQGDPTVSLTNNRWDGIWRYTGSQQLFGFPLAVVVGLSQEEQLATMHRNTYAYLRRAIIGSGLLVLVTMLLGRMSWQLARARERESEARLAYAQRIEYLAYHDGLTALPNRSLFNKLLGQAISQAQRHQRRLAVAFIDLDRFKQINDTLGHEAGDDLLKEVSTRLKACLRGSDTVARLGGDEFVVLLTEIGELKHAETVARKLITAIAKPFVLSGQDFRVTASIGISTYPKDGLDEVTLTKNADIAMYQAKQDGKNNFQFYSETLNTNSLERLSLESSLRHALERNEFELHYQAKWDTASGRITGMEALLRWRHPDLGLVAPMQFIPVAEETGLIVPIGKWVLETACLQSMAWAQQGLPRLGIAVNLTARQFSDEFLLEDIARILRSTGMEARFLEIEIHEGLLIHDIKETLRILAALKAMGVKLAIDDFGTGYSSLSTLQQFPVDTIKIDRAFIRDVTAGGTDSNLTDAIIAMGKSLSLTVVAQGVETKEQADLLREHACDEFQGFYFNKPMSAREFTALLLAATPDLHGA